MSAPREEHRLIGDPVPARMRISPETTGVGHRITSASAESTTAPERTEPERRFEE
ncbi:hypothetical protein ACOQFL_20580 [Actinopolyspora sp. H202]|uniref:hypothetical protein n=1 Tax=Actinopolyspora sp. H202 TaxID=1500456 RepID=UPI003EE700C2